MGKPKRERKLDENEAQAVVRNLRVSPQSVAETDIIAVRVELKNEGPRAAEETVFLFTHDKVASVARPLLELKGFGKMSLRPGETGTVNLSLPASQLRFLGPDLASVFEPGEVEILVGPCADRGRLLVKSVMTTNTAPAASSQPESLLPQ